MLLNGFYQYPGRAAREAARLTLRDRHLTLELAAQPPQTLLPGDVEVSDALGTIPLTLTFADGGRFVPEDDAAFRQWWQQQRRPGLVRRLEQHRSGVAITLLATVAAIVLYVWVLLPAASSALAYHMPAYLERQLGSQTLKLLRAGGFRDAALKPEQQQHLEQLFHAVTPAEMRGGDSALRLRVMQTPDGPNAFMLADGTLILSDELLKIAPGDDALAAVMLHEMGHHHYRHPMRMLIRSSLVSISFMWFTGDVSGVGDTLLQSAGFFHQLQFSRSMEREADAWAVTQMKAQHRSLPAMVAMFRALEQSEPKGEKTLRLPVWISTHPAMNERIKAIEAAE